MIDVNVLAVWDVGQWEQMVRMWHYDLFPIGWDFTSAEKRTDP